MTRILIVDDSNLSRRILRKILEDAGHSVIEESNGLSALERYFVEKPDLVFLDMTMEGMHGLEVLTQLRAMDKKARIVVGTADIQNSTRELSQAGGANGFVAKPFNAETVAAAVQAALDGPQP